MSNGIKLVHKFRSKYILPHVSGEKKSQGLGLTDIVSNTNKVINVLAMYAVTVNNNTG